jgi:hypothetical protein
VSYDEIDLPDVLEYKFLKARAIAFIIGGADFKLEIALLRIKKRE